MEMVDRSAEMSERRVCSDWVNTTLVDRCWIALEYGRVMEEILDAGADLTLKIETGLRNIREEKEAEVALLMEEEARRHKMVERLRLAWRKKMEHQKYERMMTELSKLTMEELDEDMETIELLVKTMMICESGGYTGKYSTIPMDDMEMLDTAKKSTKDTIIRWSDEQMDTITLSTEDAMDKGLLEDDNMMMANTDLGELNMDTMSEEVGIWPEGGEGKGETLCGMGGS
jgi:hypothetical protein